MIARPLHLCPVCLRQLCWNRRFESVPYQQNRLDPETGWYEGAIAALTA
jgi:hypothetical protein